MLTALAAATERMQLGNAVIPMEFENPFHFAEEFAVPGPCAPPPGPGSTGWVC
jgi:hypothetical protein